MTTAEELKLCADAMTPNFLNHLAVLLRRAANELESAEARKRRLDWLGQNMLLGSDGRITAVNIERLLDEDLSNGVESAIDASMSAQQRSEP